MVQCTPCGHVLYRTLVIVLRTVTQRQRKEHLNANMIDYYSRHGRNRERLSFTYGVNIFINDDDAFLSIKVLGSGKESGVHKFNFNGTFLIHLSGNRIDGVVNGDLLKGFLFKPLSFDANHFRVILF